MNKRVLITGATSGIGLETAKALSKLSFDITIIGRNESKLKRVIEELRSPNIEVDYIVADLSLMHEVRTAAEVFQQRHKIIDVLINNAGLIVKEYQETAEGYEKSFATNHLAPFLLTNLLFNQIAVSERARIINVSSAAHAMGKIHFDNLMFKTNFSSSKTYAQAKLANVFFTYELARRLEGTSITVNCLHPGVVKSNFSDGLNPVYSFLWKLFTPFLISTKQGAETSIYLSTSENVANISGKYFVNKKQKSSSPSSYDLQVAKMLWKRSEELCDYKTVI